MIKILDYKFLNKKHKYLVSLIILIFFSLIFQISINKERQIIYNPDDNYHQLAKSNNFHHCEKNNCFEKNLYKFKTKEDLQVNESYSFERQIHRLIISYHPLYTLILNKISNIKNSFEIQKKFHLFLTAVSTLLIFLIIKEYVDKKYIILFTVIFATHFNIIQGYQYINPSLFATTLAFYSFFLQYKNRYLSILLFFISILFHKGAALIFAISYLTFLISSLQQIKKINKLKTFFINEIKFLLIIMIVLFIGYKFIFTPFINNLQIFDAYSSMNKSFMEVIKNLIFFYEKSLITMILLNPILIYFFIKTYFTKVPKKISKLKIFMILHFITSLLFINGVDTNKLALISWSIIILNYLILSFYSLMYSDKSVKIRNFFYVLVPIFVFFNLFKNIESYNLKIKQDNFYYDYKNIKKFLKKTEDNKGYIYFNGSESTFYYYFNAGFVKRNFIFKNSFVDKNLIEDVNYIISDNPLIYLNNNSDLIINNNSQLKIISSIDSPKLVLFSKNKTELLINKKPHKLHSGYNIISFNSNNLSFNTKSSTIRLNGIKIEKNQKTNWPWFTNFKFDYTYGDYNNYFNKINYGSTTRYDFKRIHYKIFNEFMNCKKDIVSDIDTSIITKVVCN
tara:strand:- start:449 stop:2314 length:1866 start_codon:yes stop_codon:yes gene_type:complete